MAEADEVLGGRDRSSEVVGVDVGHGRGTGVWVDGDDQPGLADVVDGRGDEDDPVGQRAAQSDTLRRSQPACSRPWPLPEYTISS